MRTKNPSQLSKSQILEMVADQVSKRVNDYLEKKERYAKELAFDLEQLYIAYGTDLVKMIIEHGGVEPRKYRRSKPVQDEGTPVVVGLRKPRNSGGMDNMKPPGSSDSGNIGTAELTALVNDILPKNFKGKKFLGIDVGKIIEDRGLKFHYSILSTILRRTNGVRVVGKTKNEKAKGPPRFVYQFKA